MLQRAGNLPPPAAKLRPVSAKHTTVLTAVITDTFDNGQRTGVSDAKAFASLTAKEGLSSCCSVQANISHYDVVLGDNLWPRVHGYLSSRETLSGVEPLSTFSPLSKAAVAFLINELSKLLMPADGLSSEAGVRSGLRSRPRLRHLAWPSVTLPVEEIRNVKNEGR
jgi:hypothetical protein